MTPTIGRIVHYVLTEQDAEDINRRRSDYTRFRQGLDFDEIHPGELGKDGAVRHFGSRVSTGQVVAGMVTSVHSEYVVNLKLLLDGNDDHWIRSTEHSHGHRDGTWDWPPHVA